MRQSLALISFTTLLLTQNSLASFIGGVSAATAGAGRADIEPTESSVVNPAAIGMVRGYFFSTSYSTVSDGQGQGQDLAVGLADNTKESAVPAAFHYVQSRWSSEESELFSKDFQLSFGNMLGKGLAAGFSVRMHTDDEPEGKKYTQWTGGIGALWAITKATSLAATIENIYPVNNEVPGAYRLTQRIGLGAAYRYRKLVVLKMDLESASNQSFAKPALAGGMEYLMNRWFIMRLGIGRNWEQDVGSISAGLGFQGPKFRVNYALKNDEGPAKDTLARHAVDLIVPVW